jgi:hypothetical protein
VAAVAHLATTLHLQLPPLNHVVSLVVVALVSRVPLHSCSVLVTVSKVTVVSYLCNNLNLVQVLKLKGGKISQKLALIYQKK